MANLYSYLLELILADQLADLPPIQVQSSSGEAWQFYISNIRANIGRSTGRSTSPIHSSRGEGWQYYVSTIRANIGRSTEPDLHPYK